MRRAVGVLRLRRGDDGVVLGRGQGEQALLAGPGLVPCGLVPRGLVQHGPGVGLPPLGCFAGSLEVGGLGQLLGRGVVGLLLRPSRVGARDVQLLHDLRPSGAQGAERGGAVEQILGVARGEQDVDEVRSAGPVLLRGELPELDAGPVEAGAGGVGRAACQGRGPGPLGEQLLCHVVGLGGLFSGEPGLVEPTAGLDDAWGCVASGRLGRRGGCGQTAARAHQHHPQAARGRGPADGHAGRSR